jgi:hypothetical protein
MRFHDNPLRRPHGESFEFLAAPDWPLRRTGTLTELSL